MKLRKYLINVKLLILIGSVIVVQIACESSDELVDFDFGQQQQQQQQPKNNNQIHNNKNQNYNENFENFEYYDADDDGNESESNNEFGTDGFNSNYHVDDDDDNAINQRNPFNIKEKFLRTTLAKALTNKSLRQKFVEVLPILRVLSSQQRLALSALISAQITAKPGTELKLDQVRSMFGNSSKKLILPLVFDIANLVRNAAKSSLHYQYELFPHKHQNIRYNQTPLSRRNDDNFNDDNFNDAGIIDAKTINNELTRNISPHESLELNVNTRQQNRMKRSVFHTQQFTMPSPSIPSLDRKVVNERKLNISSFIHHPIEKHTERTAIEEPEVEIDLNADNNNDYVLTIDEIDLTNRTSIETLNLTLYEIENLAFADLNGTDYNFNETYSLTNDTEELPTPESLIASPRIRLNSNKINSYSGSSIRKSHKRLPARTRTPVHPVTAKSCERFTPSMCIRANDYPTDQIMGSIRRHKHAMSALLAEYRDKTAELEYQEYLEEVHLNTKRRREDQNEVTPGGMCSSIVRYARPQKARSASGEWKYIVNTGQHTQTLRLEKCSNPQDSCSYLSENYRSRCIQVYNYHRLLSWDKNRGLHVDIFKIPTCCSCHVDGYRDAFPPLGGSSKIHDYQTNKKYNSVNNDEYGNDDIEYEEDDDDDGIDIDESEYLGHQFANGFNRLKPKYSTYDAAADYLQLSSSNVKNNYDLKSKKRTTIPDAYLSPPQVTKNKYNRGGGSSTLRTIRIRRPTANSYSVDDRSDQDSSGTEVGKEVTVYPTSEKSSSIYSSKRKRLTSSAVSTVKTTKFVPVVRYTTSTTTSSPAQIYGRRKTTVKPYASQFTSTIATIDVTPSDTIRSRSPSIIGHPTLFSTKLTNSVKQNESSNNSKRINYNYHPIIDFFEDGAPSLQPSALPKNYVRPKSTTSALLQHQHHHHHHQQSTKDSRIGLGQTNWHPLI